MISSSWHKGRTFKQLQSIFEINGLFKVIGMTPIIDGAIRGSERQEYINNSKGTKKEVNQFIIIDDEEEMGGLKEYLIETDFKTGITKSIKDEVIIRLT